MANAWNRIDKNYRSYLKGVGISAEEYNDAPLKEKSDLRNNFLEDQRRATAMKSATSEETLEVAGLQNIIDDDDNSTGENMSEIFWNGSSGVAGRKPFVQQTIGTSAIGTDRFQLSKQRCPRRDK